MRTRVATHVLFAKGIAGRRSQAAKRYRRSVMVTHSLSCCVVLIVLMAGSAVGGEVQSMPPDGSPLRGNFKWLLHLGQNPRDGFPTAYPPDPEALKPFTG